MNVVLHMLYHGSKTPGIKVLKPAPHDLVGGDTVVFATSDIRFALAMIHALDSNLAVGYIVDRATGNEAMYIKECVPNGFQTLMAPGVMYTLPDTDFTHDTRLSHAELLSYQETLVLTETYVPDTLAALRAYEIDFIPFEDVRMSA